MEPRWNLGPFAVALLFATLAAGAAPARAGNWYVGGGLEFGRTASEEKTLLDGYEGGSFTVVGGYRFNPVVSLDVCLSGPAGVKSYHTILSLGPRFDLLDLRTQGWSPWIALYVSDHMLEWENSGTEANGLGLSAGLGVDLLISGKGSIQPAIRFHSFDARLKGPGGTDLGAHKSTTIELTVAYVFHFWD